MGTVSVIPTIWDNENFCDLSPGAKLLWWEALCWCGRHPRSGNRIPAAVASRFGGHDAHAAELVKAKWWTHDGGVIVVLNPRHECGPTFKIKGKDPRWSNKSYDHIYERDGYMCRYCGSTRKLSIDHVQPRFKGGSNEAENLVAACKSCNSRKGARTPEQAGMVLRTLEVSQ